MIKDKLTREKTGVLTQTSHPHMGDTQKSNSKRGLGMWAELSSSGERRGES